LFSELWLASYIFEEYEAIIDKYVVKFYYKNGIYKLYFIL